MAFLLIDRWYEPTDTLRKISGYAKYTHMSRDDHGFLSGVIKKIRPKKVLEVGVAEGGTTAMIITSLEMAKCECEMFSSDILNNYRGKEVGSMLNIIPKPKYVKHTLYTGTILKDNIFKIGEDIDLVILDTSHNIPGEIIEFLTVFPFLSKNAYVILHDVNLCNLLAIRSGRVLESFRKTSPKVLFGTVSGEKYFNYDENELNNIAAFKINDCTRENIDDLFFSLSHLWYYGFSKEVLNEYKSYFQKYYSEESLKLWDLAINNQYHYRKNMNKTHKYLKFLDKYLQGPLYFKLILYNYYQKYLKHQ